MSGIRFNHVFAALLLLSALSAFVIPERYTTKAQPQIQALFTPVAKPVRGVAAWATGRFDNRDAKDSRDVATLVAENDSLRQELLATMQVLDELRRRQGELENLGSIKDACALIRTVASDAASRESLLLKGTTFDGLQQGQFVISPRGLVGQIERPPGFVGAQVRLITDPGVRVEGYFAESTRDEAGRTALERIDVPPPLIQGIGKGAMQCLSLTMEDAKKLKVGMWAMLEDKDWDERLFHRPLGKIVHIAPQTAAPLYADIRIEPAVNLSRLREVMVLTK